MPYVIRRETATKPGTADLKAGLTSLAIFLVCAAPGLVPALMLVFSDRHDDAATANRIQVFQRLRHHLDPVRFRKLETEEFEIELAWLQYAVMLVFWLALRARLPQNRAEKWFSKFVLATAVIALAGLAVGLMPRDESGFPTSDALLADLRVTLMKFYAFRLFDAALPIALAVTVAQAFDRSAPSTRRGWLATAGVFGAFLVFALVRPIPDRNPSRMRPAQRADWLDVCQWMRENTPEDAQVRTPLESWGFKWYAQRAEYVSYKDCPQDAAGILEWRRRQHYIYEDWDTRYATFSREALLELVNKEGITYFICRAKIAEFDIKPVYKNAHYRVYRLADAKQ